MMLKVQNMKIEIKGIDFKDTLDIHQRVLWPNKLKTFCIVAGDK